MSDPLRGVVQAIPTPTKDNVLDVLQALVDGFNKREGRSQNKGMRFVTADEIESAGLPVPAPGATSGSGSGVGVTAVTGLAPISVSAGTTPVVTLDTAGVAYAKIQDVAAGNSLLGRSDNFPGSIQEMVVTGDMTKSGATFTLNDVVVGATNTKVTFNDKGLVTAGAQATLASADFANQGTTTTVLHGNAAGNPSFGAVSLTADVTGALPVANGGTNSATALSGSSIMISNGSAIVQGSAGTTTTVLHGNAAGNPSYGAVSLTADITGTLGVGNGGTGLTSGTSGGVLGFTAAGTIASSVELTASQLVLGGGAGATPVALGSLGTTATVLHGNAAGSPSFGAVALASDVSGQLPLANGGTAKNLTADNGAIVYSDADSLELLAATAVAGKALLSGSNAAPTWSPDPLGTAAYHAISNHELPTTYISGTGTAGADNTAQTVKTIAIAANTLTQVGDRMRVRAYWTGDTGAAMTGTCLLGPAGSEVICAHTTDGGGTTAQVNEAWLHYIDNTHANIIEDELGALGPASGFNVAGFTWNAAQNLIFTQNAVAGNHCILCALIVDIYPKW